MPVETHGRQCRRADRQVRPGGIDLKRPAAAYVSEKYPDPSDRLVPCCGIGSRMINAHVARNDPHDCLVPRSCRDALPGIPSQSPQDRLCAAVAVTINPSIAEGRNEPRQPWGHGGEIGRRIVPFLPLRQAMRGAKVFGHTAPGIESALPRAWHGDSGTRSDS